jgi:hypothetical protein
MLQIRNVNAQTLTVYIKVIDSIVLCQILLNTAGLGCTQNLKFTQIWGKVGIIPLS